MDKFETREPIENVRNINPQENVEELRNLLNELAELGWNSNQWSSKLPEDDDPAILEIEPRFAELSIKEKSQFFSKYSEQLPKYFFIESFGNTDFGYLRAEGKSLVECAKKLIQFGKSHYKCDHKWLYTHNNGNKTCEKCKAFVRCTVEEALEHYEKGSVKIDKHLSLYFHNKRPICTCGSHKMYYLNDSMFNDKTFQCVSCRKYWPLKFDNGKYSGLPVHPNDDGYNVASLENKSRAFNRHRFLSLGVMSESRLKQNIVRYVRDMLKHFYYVEKKESKQDFIIWIKRYVYQTVLSTKTQIAVNGIKYELEGIKNLEIRFKENDIEIEYELNIETPKKENENPEVVIKNVIDAIINNIE